MADHEYTAAEAVLSIPELLENILLDVDLPTLLKCQNVNRSFRNTTKHSLQLRREIWLEPVKLSELHKRGSLKRSDLDRSAEQEIEINPFFCQGGKKRALFGGGIQMRRDPRTKERSFYAICGKDELLRLSEEEEMGSLQESWKPMYIVRPAEESFLLELCVYNGHGWASLEVECGKRATAGAVLTTAASKIKEMDFGKFGSVVCTFPVKT